MNTKIKDIKGINCPPGKVHYIRYITKNDVATTLCDETLNPRDWLYSFNDEVNCPACLLATIKREKVVRLRKKENMPTSFYIALGVIAALAALCTVNYLF